MEDLKIKLFGVLGVTGSIAAQLLGGWNTGLQTLLMFMAIDYIMGLLLAGVFKKSNKSQTGALESLAGWKGLVRKGIALLIILIAVRLDIMLGVGQLIRNTAVIGFCLNELISIVENAGLMGVPLPPIIIQAIDILKKKSESIKIPEGDQNV